MKRVLSSPPMSREKQLSRRGLLGGVLAAALAAAVLPVRDATPVKLPDRWKGKTRWIGHA